MQRKRHLARDRGAERKSHLPDRVELSADPHVILTQRHPKQQQMGAAAREQENVEGSTRARGCCRPPQIGIAFADKTTRALCMRRRRGEEKVHAATNGRYSSL